MTEGLTNEELVIEVLNNNHKYAQEAIQLAERLEAMLDVERQLCNDISDSIEDMFSQIIAHNTDEYVEYDEATIEVCQAYMRGVLANITDTEE